MVEALVERAELQVRRRAPDAHWLLHCEPHDAAALGAETGVSLSTTMLRSQASGGWQALHLAPDEWLLIGPAGQGGELARRFAASSIPQSLVDVSERNLALEISGAAAPDLIGAGCPLDLDDAVFPPGACSRTLFGKVTVMLWRGADEAGYRMEYPRSFDGYVVDLITAAAAELSLSVTEASTRGN